MTAGLLTVRGLTKSFGATRALDSVSLFAEAGEVVAIVGENGAGKSTLMKLLAGVTKPDAGQILLSGNSFAPDSPALARRAGVALVPQEPELADHLSVAENVLLGCEPTRFGFLERQVLRKRAEQALQQVAGGHGAINGGIRALDLSPSERQRVTIARALAQPNLRVLIFDEPTSSLTAADVEHLFGIISRLKEQGIAILYVSHFLEEVLSIADRYYVLRDGCQVATGLIAETTASDLVTKMAGGVVEQRVRCATRERGRLVLEVQNLSGHPLPIEVSFQLFAGEILGIAGLVGAGRSELVRCLFGLQKRVAGDVRIESVQLRPTPSRCLERGLGLLSEDRRGEGLAHALDISRNITMSKWTGWGSLTTARRERLSALPYIERLSIRCHGPDQCVSELSGGNQQKVAIARLLHHNVDILLLDEPTRGIDVRSRLDVHRLIDELASRGKAILLISSYLPELLSLCDRIAVMCRGRLGTPKPVTDWNEHTLLAHATGVE